MYHKIGTVELESAVAVPVWAVTHILETFSSHYLKIQTIREMCIQFQQGACDTDFLIAVHSFDLYPALEQTDYQEPELVVLQSKSDSAREFWKHFSRLRRPVVLFRSGQEFSPIYGTATESALRVPSLSVESPFTMSLQGTLGTLLDLIAGRAGAVRENEINAAAIANVRNIVETSHLIEDPRTPDGVRRFAIDQMEGIINKQARINHKLGIRGRIRQRHHDHGGDQG